MRLNIEKIREEMKANGLRSADLARLMNARDQWVFAVLSGQSGKTFRVVEKLAKALNCNEKDLIE